MLISAVNSLLLLESEVLVFVLILPSTFTVRGNLLRILLLFFRKKNKIPYIPTESCFSVGEK